MKRIHLFALVMIAITTLTSSKIVTDKEMLEMGIEDEMLAMMKEDKIAGSYGEVKLPVCHGTMRIPTGYIFINKERTRRLLIDYWNNPESSVENIVGALVPNKALSYYQIGLAYVITYGKIGYVSDEDANDVDYDELLKEIQKASDEANKSLPKEQRFDIVGWAVAPKYVQNKHFLVWAKELDCEETRILNYDMRILGKEGLVSINAVANMTDLKDIVASEEEFVNCFKYDDGYRYEDFDASKDKVSDWTIGGLVAGSILAKSGFFAKLGIFLVKFGKLIVLGLVTVVGGIFRRLRKK